MVFSLGLPVLPAANRGKRCRVNFMGEIWGSLKLARKDRTLILAIAGSAYFWFLAALLGEPAVFVYGKDLLSLDDSQIGILRAFLAIGIALGSVLAGFL
ncbi:MAG: hypothetical protein VX768_17975 [Planctomycetota bacterium]|nr:hypothetical protein [Planctomycetota bacterium]